MPQSIRGSLTVVERPLGAFHRSIPSEPSSVGTSNPAQSVEFYQQLEKVSRACADAQENSMNIARSCATAQENSLNVTHEFSKLMEFFVNSLGQGGDVRTPPNSDADTASHSGTMSPLILRPREGVEEPSTHGGGELPVNRTNYTTVDDEQMETSIGHLGQIPDKDFEELRRQLALYNEEQAKVKAQMDRIHNPTLGDKLLGAFNNSPIVAFSHTAMVESTAAVAAPSNVESRQEWQD
ncbi:hypothetical protein BT96DRAFT_941745 [Gymnopus androsaceus JB14]|uniref:Uncharacterized protein n=1 Tax=Gymnopus androsaceus JB14 TaxID=1447944 RepID=A0A6A4HGQ9_9AGAR|nr:hypothetical protein BT96DRAFT_941745 [Gymnopus androsaceus JB14]